MKYIQAFLALVFLIFLSFALDNSEAAPSSVQISLESSEESPVRIIEGEYAMFEITLDNSDVTYRYTEVKLNAYFPTGVSWSAIFLDVNYNNIPDDTVALGKADMETVMLFVICDGNCSAGDTNVVGVYGQSDPRFIQTDYGEGEDPGNHTDTCGSSDCVNDTTPASASINVTNVINLNLYAMAEYSFDLDLNFSSYYIHEEWISVWQDLVITNTGYYDDMYVLNIELFNEYHHNVSNYVTIVNPSSEVFDFEKPHIYLYGEGVTSNNSNFPNSYSSIITFGNRYLPYSEGGYYLVLTVYSVNNDNLVKSLNASFTTNAVDSDKDGVADHLDNCPDTSAGESVDYEGCSDSDKDNDGDGISNGLDSCPGTVVDEAVDSNGCSYNQQDSDEDGISNEFDKCPDTILGELIDSDGCSYSQNDSDNDGVTNDKDACFSSEGDIVDENGCKLVDVEQNGNTTSNIEDNATSSVENIEETEEVSSISLMLTLASLGMLSIIRRRLN